MKKANRIQRQKTKSKRRDSHREERESKEYKEEKKHKK